MVRSIRRCDTRSRQQRALLSACQRHVKLAVLVELLLITGARVGEFLALLWRDIAPTEIRFLNTKNGRTRRVEITPRIRALLDSLPKRHAHVFANNRTRELYRNIRKVFGRALLRARIRTGDVTPHTLRHTAITRLLSSGVDDFTVMELVGHLTRRMLERYTHPATARKQATLETFDAVLADGAAVAEHAVSTRQVVNGGVSDDLPSDLLKVGALFGGRGEDRTRDLGIANAPAGGSSTD
jgi:integrase